MSGERGGEVWKCRFQGGKEPGLGLNGGGGADLDQSEQGSLGVGQFVSHFYHILCL